MAIDAILRLERTVLFNLLVAKERQAGNDHEISERIKAVVAHVSPLMERISDNMPEYTLHDPNHGAKVVELMGQIIPNSTLQALNIIEVSILIYAGYIHDLGMTCSTSERETIIASDELFSLLKASDIRRVKQIEKFKAEGNHRSAAHVEDQIFTEYLRRHHVERSASFIKNDLNGSGLEISWKGTPYGRLVQAVCDSHALPVSKLRDLSRWPRDALVRNFRVNVQYLALALRLGDILDLDPERTPKALLDFVDPQDPVSIIEWNKHRSVIGWEITPERIRFDAECTDAIYERALREFIDWIELERAESFALASSYRDDIAQVYRFDLTEPVTADRIRSNGTYIYSNLRFEVDHERVINLLMGERLYRSPALALRELIQNAFDAIRYREALERQEGNEYVPKVSISLDGDRLVVEDNGIGMDADTVQKYFMQVGRSYYTSPKFQSLKLDIDIVSEFGIGILSAFMVADRFTVESRRRPENPLIPPEPISIEVPTAHRYFVQRPSTRKNIGTKIALTLKSNHPFNGRELPSLVERMVPFGEYAIHLTINGKHVECPPHAATDFQRHRNAKQTEYLRTLIDSNEDENLKGVSGSVSIVGKETDLPRHHSVSSIVAQCGFAVMQLDSDDFDSPSTDALFPDWTQFAVGLDFRPPARLALTPDRGSIVHDENFYKVRQALDRHAVRSIERHLKDRVDVLSKEAYADYIDQMIDNGALRGESYVGFELSLEAKELFLSYIPFKCINSKGDLDRVLGNDLLKSEVIVLADPRGWPDGTLSKVIRDDVDKHFCTSYPIILDHDVGSYYRERMYDHLFGEVTGHLISSIPGIVFDLIETANAVSVDSHVDGIVHFTAGLKCADSTEAPLLIHIRDVSPVSFGFPRFNANHPVFLPLKEKILSDELSGDCRNLIVNMHEGVTEILMRSVAHLRGESVEEEIRYYRGRFRNVISPYAPNKILTGILIKDDGLFELLNEEFKTFWIELVKIGVVPGEQEMPRLKITDLPYFWSLNN